MTTDEMATFASEINTRSGKRKLRDWLRPEYLIWVLLLVLLAERLMLFRQLGTDYMSHSDDDAYVQAGLLFAETGMISICTPYPSAMIMPAMPVVIGLFSMVFGNGTALLLALKILWIVMGVATAYVCYLAVSVHASKWWGLYAAAHFLIPNMAWMNHVILTETPYMLCFALCIYFTFRMGTDGRLRYFFGYMASFLIALMFRANIITMPVFTAVYLLAVRINRKLLVRRVLLFGGIVFLILLPWTIRNYLCFGEVMPLGYGAGNPTLLGTYQGEGYPLDEELDYETNVYQPMQEKYSEYYRDRPQEYAEDTDYFIQLYDARGMVKEPRYTQFLFCRENAVQARYRLRSWWKENPGSLLKTYLYIKPRMMLNWSWAWEEAFGVSYETLHRLSQLNAVFCVLTVTAAICWKKYRPQILFLAGLYVALVYIHSMAYVTDRYASTLMIARYVLSGYGMGVLVEICTEYGRKNRERRSRA